MMPSWPSSSIADTSIETRRSHHEMHSREIAAARIGMFLADREPSSKG
jgi:hypothetical protein